MKLVKLFAFANTGIFVTGIYIHSRSEIADLRKIRYLETEKCITQFNTHYGSNH